MNQVIPRDITQAIPKAAESILEILDAINRGNDTVEKLTALDYDAKTAQEVLRRNKSKQ